MALAPVFTKRITPPHFRVKLVHLSSEYFLSLGVNKSPIFGYNRMMKLSLVTEPIFWAYAAAALLPILGWIYFFQTQHRESHRNVVLAFLAGIFSVIPIKLYEAYWDTAVLHLQHINLFQSLSELVRFAGLPQLSAFILVSIVVAFGLYVFTALSLLVLEVTTGDNTLAVYQRKVTKSFESPFLFITAGILCGLFAYSAQFSLHQKVWFFLLVGMLEEFIKHLCLRLSDEEKIKSVDDALAFSIIVALGFAFFENILYLHDFLTSNSPTVSQMGVYYVLRSTISVAAHVCFSAIFGYYYGLAKFSHEIYQQEVKNNQHPIFEWLHRVLHLKGETLYHEEKLMEGMLLAMVIHAVFNSLLQFNQIPILLPLLLGLMFIVLNLYHRKQILVRTGRLQGIRQRLDIDLVDHGQVLYPQA